jgi:hypothetical protein
MNEIEHPRPESDSDLSNGKRGHPSYWRFAHHDWRFWLGLVLIFGAMFIYLMTEDLSWRPVLQAPTAQADGSNDK